MTSNSQFEPSVGDRLVLVRNVERYPHFTAAVGSKGTVVDVSFGAVRLRLDDPLRGAEEWDNEIVWSEDAGDLEGRETPSGRGSGGR